MRLPKIVLAINYVNYRNVLRNELQSVAMEVMVERKLQNVQLVSFNLAIDNTVSIHPAFHVFRNLRRDSAVTIQNNRHLPYIKEIFDNCVQMKCDVFGYINSDILLPKNFFRIFNKKTNAYIFVRTDIENITARDYINEKRKERWKGHPGCDGIFFKRNWWVRNRNKFHNDMILGECEWDLYYRRIIKECNAGHVEKRILDHVFHETTWTSTSNGAKNNLRINGGAI